ncbi:hypothetical protein RY27_14070, partial [Litorilinea aerophila]
MSAEPERERLNRSGWAVLAAAAVLLLLSAANLVYRATLPTDGCAGDTSGGPLGHWVYAINLAGAKSG